MLRLVLFLSVVSFNVNAQTWQCRNDLEIRCSDEKCEVETNSGFTAMSVTFDGSGQTSVCAYTGCWEGKGKVFESEGFLSINTHQLNFSTSPQSTEDIAIILDRRDNIALLKAGAFAHPLICKQSAEAADMPAFDKYPVAVSDAKPKAIVFRANKDAQRFRTKLKLALQDGVTFAGHYIFASWGCGSSCVQGAIINTKTGIVYFPPELSAVGTGFGDAGMQRADKPIQYRKDSRLLILSGYAGGSERNGVSYLVWERTGFRLEKFVDQNG